MNYNTYDNLNEGKLHDFADNNKFLQNLRKQFINISPYQSPDVTIIKHEYPGYLKYIQTRKYKSDLEHFINNDIPGSANFFNAMKQTYANYLKGTNTGNKEADKMLENLKEHKVTGKDFSETVKWLKTVCVQAAKDRMKEVEEKYGSSKKEEKKEEPKKSTNESGLDFTDPDFMVDHFTIDENFLLEYSGKEALNNEYAKVLADFCKVFQFYVDADKVIADVVSYAGDVSKIKKIDSNSKCDPYLDSCYKFADEAKGKITKLQKDLGVDISKTYKAFYKLNWKFAVKYSNVTLEEKKKYEEEYKKYFYDIVEIDDKFGSYWINSINTELKKIRENISEERYLRIIAFINAWLQYLYRCTEADTYNIRYISYHINPDIENTLRYQLVQYFLKK